MTIANNVVAKAFAAFVAASMLFSLAFAPAANAQTTAELQALIASLQAQIAALTGQAGGTTGGAMMSYTFTRDLTVGATGEDVMQLQKFLNSKGHTVAATGAGSPGMESNYFGSLTAAALAKYQASKGITPAVGYFGPVTRAAVHADMAAAPTPTPGGSTGSGSLQGGAGSIEDADYVSKLSNEEVGEGEEDVEVAGLEIEADGSDIELTAVNLNFSEGTAGSDFDKYAEEVSVWFDGEEIARVDADEFEDDDLFNKNISLDSGAVIEEGETGELVVAVTGIGNLDSTDAGDTWTLEFESVRFRDAQGAVVTDSDTGDINDGAGRTFSFTTFATAADVELKITSGDDDVNDPRAVDVDDSDDTDDVELLSFTLEAEGDSDITIDDMPVLFTAVGADVDVIANTVYLVVDGEQVGSETVSTSATTSSIVTFDNLDWTLEAGDTVDVLITADINDIEGTFGAGDTLAVSFAEAETDNTLFEVEDEEGEELADADKTGSSSSGPHAFFDVGINLTFVSADADAEANDNAVDNDQGIFQMVFDITAFGGSVYVGDTSAGTTDLSLGGQTAVTDAIVYRVYDSGTATTDDLADTVTFTTPSGVTDSTDNILINEGKTSRITLTVTQTNGTAEDDGIYYMELGGVAWGLADDTTYEFMYSFDMDDFETNTITLN